MKTVYLGKCVFYSRGVYSERELFFDVQGYLAVGKPARYERALYQRPSAKQAHFEEGSLSGLVSTSSGDLKYIALDEKTYFDISPLGYITKQET